MCIKTGCACVGAASCASMCEVYITTIECEARCVIMCSYVIGVCIGLCVCTYSDAAFLHTMSLDGFDHSFLTCLNANTSSYAVLIIPFLHPQIQFIHHKSI